MDTWEFFDITHRDHVICNPLSPAKLDELVELLDLTAGARVLDIACGKGELLVRLAERYAVEGVGVDISPYCIRDATRKAATRVPGARLEFIEADGARYDIRPGSFDCALCIGATWVFGGYRGTLGALRAALRPGGQLAVGEPYWRIPPSPEYLAALRLRADEFGTHAGNVATGVEEGLIPLYTLMSNEDDWDRYEALQWRAAERYAAAHPGDPDVPGLLERVRRDRDAYLRWGRQTLGWGIYLFGR